MPLSLALGGRSVEVLGSMSDFGSYSAILLAMCHSRYGTRITALVGWLISAGANLALAAWLLPAQASTEVLAVCFFCIGQGFSGYGLINGATAQANEVYIACG